MGQLYVPFGWHIIIISVLLLLDCRFEGKIGR